MIARSVALAVVVGVALGLLGGGGSILMVPLLTGVAGMDAHHAIATSLLVVGVTSRSRASPAPGRAGCAGGWQQTTPAIGVTVGSVTVVAAVIAFLSSRRSRSRAAVGSPG
jgi:uncharacterized membrane protein YfcA